MNQTKTSVALLSLIAVLAACGDDEPAGECVVGELRDQSCGLNDRGVQAEACQETGWTLVGPCADPDLCTDDAVQSGITACGFNGGGVLEQTCQAGAWADGTNCVDPDACTTGETRILAGGAACGAVGFEIGTEVETCVAGQWSAEGDCTCGDTPYPGDFIIYTEADIILLSGISQLTGQLTIADSFARTDLTGLEGLKCVGALIIDSSPTLTSLTGLDALTSVGANLNLDNNATLSSLAGLEALTSVGGRLYVTRNVMLPSLAGLDALTTIGLDLWVSGNSSLVNLSGLGALTSIRGIDIRGNDSLQNLSGLDSLTSMSGLLSIGDNAALTSLTGLDALTSIGGILAIFENDNLATIGLGVLDEVGGNVFRIQDNPKLSVCDATALYDGLSSKPTGEFVEYTIGNLDETPCP